MTHANGSSATTPRGSTRIALWVMGSLLFGVALPLVAARAQWVPTWARPVAGSAAGVGLDCVVLLTTAAFAVFLTARALRNARWFAVLFMSLSCARYASASALRPWVGLSLCAALCLLVYACARRKRAVAIACIVFCAAVLLGLRLAWV
jgi:hypothetical protein